MTGHLAHGRSVDEARHGALYDAFISYSHAQDKPIAAALQTVVQRLGKPWYRRRALRVFRDGTSLSATPGLWPAIERALSQSRFFILLAAPESANSKWVNKEVSYWLERNSADTLLIGVTDGELTWDEGLDDFRREHGLLPPALAGHFPTEPKWVDLRAYREGASPRDARFIEHAADFAATIRGMPKEDLLSQEVRQQRRSLRLAWSAAGALLVLVGLAILLAVMAYQQRNEALTSQSVFLADQSRGAAGKGDAATALLLALAALPTWKSGYDRPVVPEALRSLYRGLFSLREAADFKGHTADVNTVALDPPGAMLLTSSDDHTARLWDAQSGDLSHLLAGHENKVSQAKFSPDGRLVATASDDSTAKIWDSKTGRLMQTLSGHQGPVRSVAFDPGGRRVATGGADGTVRLWPTDGGTPAVLREHGPVTMVMFSPDGKLLLSTSDDRNAILWDVDTGKLINKLVGHTQSVLGGEFDPTGSVVATFSRDKTARVWDATTGEQLGVLTHGDWVRSAIFCPVAKCLITASDDGTARVWHFAGDRPAIVLDHGAPVRKAVPSRDGKLIATAGEDGALTIWSAQPDNSYTKLTTLTGHTAPLLDVAFDPAGRYLATSSRGRDRKTGEHDATARTWDLLAPTSARVAIKQEAPFTSVAPSPDGSLIATAEVDGSIVLWDANTLTKIAKTAAHSEPILSIAFSPDGSKIVTASKDGTAAVWHAPDLALQQRLPAQEHAIADASFDGDSGRVVFGTYGGSIVVWNLKTNELTELERHAKAATGAKFSPRSDLVLATFIDGTARIWDLNAGRVLVDFKQHRGAITHAAFSPGRDVVATSAEDGWTYVWDAKSGEVLGAFKHASPPTFADLSFDGDYLATVTGGTITLWQLGKEAPLAEYEGHWAKVNAVKFLPNSPNLVSVSAGGEMQEWGLKTPFADLLDFARELAPRCLSIDQMKRYGIPSSANSWCTSKQVPAE